MKNLIIGDGKRLTAYELIKRLEENRNSEIIKALQNAVGDNDRKGDKKHEVWKDLFDW